MSICVIEASGECAGREAMSGVSPAEPENFSVQTPGEAWQFCPVKNGKSLAVVLVTAPDLKVARRLARGALRAKLVACGNLVPKIESHYWWQGRIETSAEVLILFKTTRSHLPAFEKYILAEHPYDTPEFVVLPLGAGTQRYLDWISASVA